MGSMASETPPAPDLTGSPRNPAREPRRKTPAVGKGSLGDQAFMDSVLIVAVAWAFVLFSYFSLRSSNV